ncbi:Protein-serine/threonine phosphatase [Aphelenchoides fujianensis]|nr:Protein-serine/threonine phosphatase [Aphelenchoides fujianensis]
MVVEGATDRRIPFRPSYRGGRLRFAVSCSSNMNRSMEAHQQLLKRGFMVESYGSGTAVKLPGPAPDRPNVYDFDQKTYAQIQQELYTANRSLYTKNGLLAMLERNKKIKERPQKFQKVDEEFDVVVCLEERVYDQIVDFFHKRPSTSGALVHVINVDIKDTHEEAVPGALVVCHLCEKLQNAKDLDHDIDDILVDLDAEQSERNFLHSIHFY